MNQTKFSDFEKLNKSYNQLEKEFTKKCQAISQSELQFKQSVSDLEKQLELANQQQTQLKQQNIDLKNQLEQSNQATTDLKNQLEQKHQVIIDLQNQLDQIQTHCGTSVETPPQKMFSQEEFFSEFPHAEKFKEEILFKVSDPMYQQKPDGFLHCYIDLLTDKILPAEQLAEQDHFLQQYILPNPVVLQKILQAVQSSCQYNSPVTISGNGGNMSLAMPTRPKTIEEASELAKKYFK